jgi:hypothetical protein
LEFTDRGLAAEPKNLSLLNNKAVGLAYLGRIREATNLLYRLVIDQAPAAVQPALYATTGLLFFRSGDAARGRAFYEKAIANPYSRKDRRCHVMALWHLAREEARIGSEYLPAVTARAERASKDMKLPEIAVFRERIKQATDSSVRAVAIRNSAAGTE